MWKNLSFGILALLLGSAGGIGQEKPRRMEYQVFPGRNDEGPEGDQTNKLIHVLARHSTSAAPVNARLIIGDLKSALAELEVVALVVHGDGRSALTALDTATRQTMRARRFLRTLVEDEAETGQVAEAGRWVDGVQRGGVVAVTLNGERLVLSKPREETRITGLQAARNALTSAVTSLRRAEDIETASKALDEVDRSVAALRGLLWKQKADGD